MPTKIEWTDETWNPVRGCSRVSEGCRNCYAEREANRHRATLYKGLVKITNGRPAWTGKVRTIPEKFADPMFWRKPRRIFVNSMSDLFHEGISDETLVSLFAVMGNSHIATGVTRTHQFQILTKRPERMWDFMTRLRWRVAFGLAMEAGGRTLLLNNLPYLATYDPWGSIGGGKSEERPVTWVPPQVMLGVSFEDQVTADQRIPWLLKTPAAQRFASYEPALGAVNLREALPSDEIGGAEFGIFLDWVIVGGESGPNARPATPEWFRSVRDQCVATGVPFFFKQWGEWSPTGKFSHAPNAADVPVGDGSFHRMLRVGKKHAGRRLDGKEWSQFPTCSNAG